MPQVPKRTCYENGNITMELKDLKGKFHAHITVLCKHIPALEAKAKANKAKCTVIHLEKKMISFK